MFLALLALLASCAAAGASGVVRRCWRFWRRAPLRPIAVPTPVRRGEQPALQRAAAPYATVRAQ